MKKLAIIGAGGHGKVIADIAIKNGYGEIVFLDDEKDVWECGGYPIVGTTKEANRIDADIIVGIGNARIRKRMMDQLKDVNIVTLIHPNAVIADDVVIGDGTVVMAGTVINPGTVIGKGCIVNTSASVDHDCKLGDYVHVAVGAHICGNVTIEDNVWIGAGTVVSNNIFISQDCLIGAGSVVVKDILEAGTYVGVPAKLK